LDRWQTTTTSKHLRGRVSTGTAPEMAARRALHSAGYRFRLNVQLARGCRPDVLLPRHHVALFVHGDFWHFCPVHVPDTPLGPNADLWQEKKRANAERDRRALETARSLGWEPVVVWECELREDCNVVVRRVAQASRA
jgi:DNA mismatch endonuclease (patch repair protein)